MVFFRVILSSGNLHRQGKKKTTLSVNSIDVYTYSTILIIKGPKSVHFCVKGYFFSFFLLFSNYQINYLKLIAIAREYEKDIGF